MGGTYAGIKQKYELIADRLKMGGNICREKTKI
jgi:hypothetical protein|uniref:Uncharacterized protein n=1 Tax=Myoviridae sp. cthRr4 TaxID=2825152 RepID=A0A8S5NVC5_9CAUD|nr:MAG TPA: hypothetical protein [Myoviridae sp. cthRr4]